MKLNPGSANRSGQAGLRNFVICLLMLGIRDLSAQESPTLRVESNSVLVDVVVTDKKSQHIKDLVKENFLVFEDGVPQTVDTVFLVSSESVPEALVASSPTMQTRVESQTIQSLTSLEGGPNLVIFLLDFATIQYLNQTYVRDAAIRYVQERVRPSDLIAVFRVGRSLKFVQEFTNDKDRLVEALSAMDVAGSAFGADQEFLADAAQGAEDMVESLAASIGGLTAAAGFGPGVAQAIVLLNNQMEKIESVEGSLNASLSYSRDIQARPVIGAIRSIAEAVRPIDGRKTLVLFSEGFVVPATLEYSLIGAVDYANRANLAVYAINAQGLGPREWTMEPVLEDISANKEGDRVKAYGGLSLFDRAKEVGFGQQDATLLYLTKQTGGFYVKNTNDFLGALQRVEDDIRLHYILAYRSTNGTFDGEFRSIRVEVKRPGVEVRSRSGYWAVPPGASMLSAEEFRAFRKADSSASDEPSNELPLFVQTNYFRTAQEGYRVRLTIEVPVPALASEEDSDLLNLKLFGLVQNELGHIVSSFRGPSRVVLKESGQSKEYLRLENQILLRPGSYSLCVVASTPDGEKSGFRKHSLRLPVLEGDFSVSSLAVSETVGVGPDGRVDENGDLHLFPSARRQFSEGDQIVYYFDVYGSVVSGGEGLGLRVSLSRRGRELASTSEVVGAADFRSSPIPHLRLARVLDLKGLEPGRYLLRAEVDPRGVENKLTTQTTFEIVP